jgi:hyperosmotically inducible protein
MGSWRGAGLGLLLLCLGGCAAGVLTGAGRSEPAANFPAESDARITNEINRRLVADPLVDALAITVETRLGIVTLSGRVADKTAYDRAAQIARGVPGVKELRNNLLIGKTLKH